MGVGLLYYRWKKWKISGFPVQIFGEYEHSVLRGMEMVPDLRIFLRSCFWVEIMVIETRVKIQWRAYFTMAV